MLVAPGSSVEADFDEYVLCSFVGASFHTPILNLCDSDQNAEAFN
jgi:hypothetical protein